MYLGQFYSVQIDMKHNLLSLGGGWERESSFYFVRYEQN